MFIGREKEIQELIEMYASNKMEAMFIYGRRRVGKTIIINESLKDYNGIVVHYECKKVSLESNLEMLTELFCKQLNLSNISFINCQIINLKYLHNRIINQIHWCHFQFLMIHV